MKLPHAGAHNIYGLEMTRATREGVQRLSPGERVFVLTRASYAGGQRYAAAWTGDNVASWEHLGMALRMCLNFSISGQPFVGSDIGGFIGAPSGELFARWLQLGAFTPLMRAHSVINEKNKEPWEYGAAWTRINRKTIELRYRFLPYIYTVMREASISGIPAMRSMVLSYPDDPRSPGIDDQFMFGSDLLVAPVLEEGKQERDVQLPTGTWYDVWSDSAIAGGRTVTVRAPLEQLPLFARAGAIVPTQQVMQYSDETPIDPLTFLVFPPDSTRESTAIYYEDDGHSLRYTAGDYFLRTISQRWTGMTQAITLSRPEGSFVPPPRTDILELHGNTRLPVRITRNGREILRVKQGGNEPGKPSWSFDRTRNVISINFPETPDEETFLVDFR